MKKLFRSLRFKTILPLLILTFIFGGFICSQVIFLNYTQETVEEMNDKYFKTTGMIDELKIVVVELQQSITEASVTKDKEKKNEAIVYQDEFYAIAFELMQMNPEISTDVTKIEKSFDENYWAGREMANAYIDEGTVAGNVLIAQFNETSETINNEIDSLKATAVSGIKNSIKRINNIAMITQFSIIGVGVAFIVVLFFSMIYIKKKILKPLDKVLDKVKSIASNNSDLTEKIVCNSKDEIGELADNFNLMQESFRNIISVVQKESGEVEKSIDETSGIIDELSNIVKEVNYNTKMLSDSMNENLASTEEMTSITHEMVIEINEISSGAHEGANNAKTIEERTAELKEKMHKSSNEAEKINNETHIKLKKAIEQTEDVKEIESLSEIILKISSEISLLALNASIEAARAGDAGRGFSVVAKEIDNLAESSKYTVTKIKKVTDSILIAVDNLVKTSNEMLEFVDGRVIKDYKMISLTSEKYSQDAAMFSAMTSSFYERSEKVEKSMGTFLQLVKEINTVSSQSTISTSEIADSTEIMVEKYSGIMNAVTEAGNSTKKLLKTLDGFVV